MKLNYLCILTILILCPTSSLISQTMTIKLWPSGAPGSISDRSYHEDTVYTESGLPRVRHVTDPEMTAFLPEKKDVPVPAVIICPGGGYARLAIDHEGMDVARWFSSIGVAGFVLKYRLPSDTIMKQKSIGPLQDIQEAIRIVRRRAIEWGINPGEIGVAGFSAGGHLAGSASTLYNEKTAPAADTVGARPDFSIIVYGVLSMKQGMTHGGSRKNLLGTDPDTSLVTKFSAEENVTSKTPPAFIVHAANDPSVPVASSLAYFTALKKASVPAELHVYQTGGHGFGLAPHGGTESGWPEACRAWLIARKILK
jgi:acetyl esterase/lipase